MPVCRTPWERPPWRLRRAAEPELPAEHPAGRGHHQFQRAPHRAAHPADAQAPERVLAARGCCGPVRRGHLRAAWVLGYRGGELTLLAWLVLNQALVATILYSSAGTSRVPNGTGRTAC